MVPCNETARQSLANSLFEVNEAGIPNLKSANYVARTFPSILLDIARLVTEQATKLAHEHQDNQTVKIRHQLKPYFMFGLLLGKCPQITSLMYSYFENSSFQPLPEDSFHWNKDEQKIVYTYQGFSDELVIEILTCYFKYLAFNPKWFSTKWNWSELGRFITMHPNHDIRFIAASCLSAITNPPRAHHMSFMSDVIGQGSGVQLLIDLQIKHRQIFTNTFKPCIESKHQKAVDYVKSIGFSSSGYAYCEESIAKLANVLLLKRDISQEIATNPNAAIQYQSHAVTNYIAVSTLIDAVSKLAYAISVNKPCLIRGLSGYGKTAILDYVAAKTNRMHPPDYVKVQIGDQIDSKLLIGTYVCTEIPGQFEWIPGPLTRAMIHGSWIVFEDIDSAPSEVIQVMHSVIENGNLSCVSCCPIKLDNPHPDFRIFFTQRTKQASQTEMSRLGLSFVDRFCDIIDLPELNSEDLIEVIEARYKLGPMAQVALELYESAKCDLPDKCQSRTYRQITPRDLFKFCARIADMKLQLNDGKYNSRDLEMAYLDAIDCFLASMPRADIELSAPNLGRVTKLTANEIQRLLTREPELKESDFKIGRIKLSSFKDAAYTKKSRATLAKTKQTCRLLENVASCIKQREPVLFVGETGVGKTFIIQYLADMMEIDLIVVNLSQQSDSSDLLGGYKPIDMRQVMTSIHQKFEDLFNKTLRREEHLQSILSHANNLFINAKKNSQWLTYLKLVRNCCGKALINKKLEPSHQNAWCTLSEKVSQLIKPMELDESTTPMMLAFSDGSLLKAVKEGKWILLDEINLAEPDVLQCLLLILDSINQSHIYMQSCAEDSGQVEIHRNFRLFACMNPSTDIGKKDLDSGTRGRFTEFFVDEIGDKIDIRKVVESYVKSCLPPSTMENIVKFYMEIRSISGSLSDISGNPPVYSLRSLCRALSICSLNVCQNMEKSVYECLKITFFQQLNKASVEQVTKLIEKIFYNNKLPQHLLEPVASAPKDGHQYVHVGGFWIQKSNAELSLDAKYIITDSIERNLQNLARIISLSQRKLPILIQGNTSVGKTSMIDYLAKVTGNRCYRINNHEHTDLQDYVGKYVLKENGDLFFQEGLLVKAMKKGYWIILDELNLAPSELLEALNRVLDDNRELFIPETRETVHAHAKFILFATQNPPEEYAGRKFLSRAFRNRFIEVHFDDIPSDELTTILEKRCEMAPKYAKLIVNVMKELQIQRRESGCFNGKSGFMTMRDLFRWGERYLSSKSTCPETGFNWDEYIAKEGLILLEGRVRTKTEADTVKTTIEKVFKVTLDRDEVYNRLTHDPSTIPEQFRHITFTREFKTLFTQLTTALKYKEPVLLCGQTGCGKTTACQLFAATRRQNIITYNCHLNTESSDLVGSVRPSREQDESGTTVKQTFPWINGPLIEAMRSGSVFLVDEIALADDAVLERMNSVLEPSRSITLTEKDGEEISSIESFRLVATMNPGGDYGKKELSPALRNRFTEIYCHNTADIQQIRKIIESYLPGPILKPKISVRLLFVMERFLQEYYKEQDIVSIRDVLSWCDFIVKVTNVNQQRPLSIQEALIDGGSLVYLDQFGTCGHTISTLVNPDQLKTKLVSTLRRLVSSKFGREPVYVGDIPKTLVYSTDSVRVNKFTLERGSGPSPDSMIKQFVLQAPTVKRNMMKLVRAMQLDRPILLEGDPGAGKTSIVDALAKLSGQNLVRINLSEQTDVSDLFGLDLPDDQNEDCDTPTFRWCDGPMLKAIKESSWILLDEMNLASQSVLEGLNACFDHRGEIYIPELNKRIKVDRSVSRIFACQNPYNQGAARKGLPKSFVNRFTSIYIEAYAPADLVSIVTNLHPSLPRDLVDNMIEFNHSVSYEFKNFGFEFNLRDILYWCDLITNYVLDDDKVDKSVYQPEKFAQFVYLDRMRSEIHRSSISEVYEKIFGNPVYEPPYRDIRLGEYAFMIARSIIPRNIRLPPQLPDLCILKCQMPYIESLTKAIEFNKMPILVGEVGVGKRSIVRIVAGLTGNVLNVIGANQEMDTSDLIGSYEQRSLQREVVDLIEEAKRCVFSVINSIAQKQHASTWTEIFDNIWKTLFVTSVGDQTLDRNEMIEGYRIQLQKMKELITTIPPLSNNQTHADMCARLLNKIEAIMQKPAYRTEPMYSPGNFQWIDSTLTRSLREGNWIMIENANLINPAILDRLNSLMEPNGSLILSEKGSKREKGSESDGEIEEIKPHPNFRLILTMDPQNGELSRAMRNRGIEIFMQPQFFFEDFLMLLNQNGFEPEAGKACMTYCIMQTSYDTFQAITGEDPMDEGSLLAYFGLNYLSTLTNQVRRGADLDEILADLLITHFTRTGFGQICQEKSIKEFVQQRMNEYRKKYEVNLDDERYKWRHLRHDLISLTGGDSVVTMVERDSRIFYEDTAIDLILKPDEIVDNLDIVNTCISVKMFLEFSTHGDFEHREGFIRDIFQHYPSMMQIVNSHVQLLHQEYLPLISSLMLSSLYLPQYSSSSSIPASEMYVDTRTAPDIHHLIQCMYYEKTIDAVGLQNRWLLSLHRIMLSMIVELVEERTMNVPGNTSLWALSEQVRSHTMMKEDLVKPVAEIATDLYDLLNGILRVVINRCFNNEKLIKILPKLFWINYVICKLRRGYSKKELVATCNQIPMLWALTYQKVIVPIIKDCELADLNYKNKKFSYRIQHICDFLDVTLSKPDRVEKSFYHKVVNKFASTTKQRETVNREVNKFFETLIGRYTSRSHSLPIRSDNTLAASGLCWSNSTYLSSLYEIQASLVGTALSPTGSVCPEDINQTSYQRILETLQARKNDYDVHEEWLTKDNAPQYIQKCLNINRRRSALDQFAPVWQILLIQNRLAKFHHLIDRHDALYLSYLNKILKHINGIIMSPRYYLTLTKFLKYNEIRESTDVATRSRENADMYVAYIQEHLLENVVLDSQIVGWTKLRVTTSDLPALAPLIPEYSPVISLVASYCLDISHLKLNSLSKSTLGQLDAMIFYLWKSYTTVKFNSDRDAQDMDLARNLMHLRSKLPGVIETASLSDCSENCQCVEDYIKRQLPKYQQLMDIISGKLPQDDVETVQKSIKLVYFGYLNFLEYAPIFSFDPSLRAREKLEVYKSELAHVKLDLHFRNTLYYWKTGENLQLLEIEPELTASYPFAVQLLVERRTKLEKSIGKLRQEHTNRPKSDDGTLYYELRKDVEVHINRYTNNVHLLMDDLAAYAQCSAETRQAKFTLMVTRLRMVIKSLEKSVSHFRSDYALYTDLLSNFLVGKCFVLQGLRCLYARLEQKMQIAELGFNQTISQHASNIHRVFSFNKFDLGNLKSVQKKLQFLPYMDRICPAERANYIQSLILRTVLIQMNHHITITPSDIKQCIPTVKRIADLFHSAWMKRKHYFEEQRKQKEELYQYKTSHTTINEIAYERQEFLDVCARFPTYDYIYLINRELPSTDKENLITEEKITNMNRSADLSMCVDICKAHYKFIKQASYSLLGQVDSNGPKELPTIDIEKWTELEAETFYAIIRHCLPTLDKSFDSLSIECHLLQAERLKKILQKREAPKYMTGTLSGSIEILDEEIFDIYHGSNSYEVLRFQDYIHKLDSRIYRLRGNVERSYDTHPMLLSIIKLMTNISSFLITDPLMKFVTGGHALLDKIADWNKVSIPKEDKMLDEMDQLIDLIKDWRSIELKSWKNSLHLVKRKYIDESLCDLWFKLYDAFCDPFSWGVKIIKAETNELVLQPEHERLIYEAFASFVKDFIEQSTLGDYQLRMDLVFVFAIQTRFAGLYKRPNQDSPFKIDHEKLTTYVYNTYIEYKGLLEPFKEYVTKREQEFQKTLEQEIRIASWTNHSLIEMKQNFRISHRKLNKVMNNYSKMLQEPLQSLAVLRPLADQDEFATNELDSDRISATLIATQMLVSSVDCPRDSANSLKPLKKTTVYVNKMKELHIALYDRVSTQYIENLASFEQSERDNAGFIKNFQSHKPSEVVLDRKDSKEVQKEKHKLCRQMHQSKKFALQSIFKNLQTLGVSYQRGLNSYETLDRNILSSEPLRGMIQDQSHLVLKAADKLIDQQVIHSCNDRYKALIACSMYLHSQPGAEELERGQTERIKGYILDLTQDSIKHKCNAAFIYKHLVDIQAIASRFDVLGERYKDDKVVIYNFSKVHTIVQQFDELVGRVYLAVAKLERLTKCCRIALDIPKARQDEESIAVEEVDFEVKLLLDIIRKNDSQSEMMTRAQIQRLEETILETRKDIAKISDDLRDMLKHNSRNHLYSDDDLLRLEEFYQQFISSFRRLLPKLDSEEFNTKPNTIIGSLKGLEDEAVEMLWPQMDKKRLMSSETSIEVDKQANLNKLNLRIQKMIRQILTAAQRVYKREMDQGQSKRMSETEKRRLKPFNHLDSSQIKDLLRVDKVAEHAGDCIATLNKFEDCTNITSIVNCIKPMLFIYSQDVSRYLNIILASLNLRLGSATQLARFFTDVLVEGFGLPYKVNDVEDTNQKSGKLSEDNVGFGEGQGETDVSKKLEFESQLDDLKTDQQKDEQKEEEKDVEAHDDGIEMSEDIDAKAQGPDQQNGSDEKKPDGDDEPEEQDNLDDLDKEFDRVDQDEDKLDENLWGDQDELPGEDDDKEDLRETDVDHGMKPDKDSIDLLAKDSELSESKPEKSASKSEETEPAEKSEDVPSTDDVIMKEQPDIGDNEDLDLAKEADEALMPDPSNQPSDTQNEETKDPEQDMIDMSLSDGELDVDEPKPEETEGTTETKSEGEISADDDESSMGEPKNSELNSQSVLDDDSIDKQLEVALKPPKIDLSLDNPIEDLVHNLPNMAQGAGQDKDGQQQQQQGIKSKKIGNYTLYEIYPEDEDELIDLNEDEQSSDKAENSREQEDEAMVTSEEQPPAKGTSVEAGENPVSQAENKIPMDVDGEEKSRPTKRTLADKQEPKSSEVKRQKILDASEESKNEKDESSTAKQADTVRHLETDKKNAIEVVDIADSDEERVDTNNSHREGDETQLKPKDITGKPTAPSADQTANEGIESDGPEIIDIDSQSTNQDKESKQDDFLKETSSISSIDTGELEADSDYEDCLEEGVMSTDRKLNTSYNTNIGLLKYISLRGSNTEADGKNQSATNLMERIDSELGRKVAGDYDSIDTDRLTSLWLDCTRSTSHLMHELCQQLQIVLQPTKMSKYKGDYKSGKRLNMRKIISYIASNYRKDKIWLRRTKPNKRTYNIQLAVDNSSSMSENNCRQMTYQSLALLASSLSRIEAGSLSVVSFGEQVKCIHDFGQPYMDAIGAQWLRELRFNETKTSYEQLLRQACSSFARQAQVSQSRQSSSSHQTVSQLLIIISDGRNVSSEEESVKNHLRQLKSMGVLTLFVIIDDLSRNSGNSIIDVKRCVGFGGAELQVVKYMELFPFPFYVLLRQLETMPSVLGDALRQWFELVSSV